MPIFEYEAIDPDASCIKCRTPFEVIQRPHDESLETCPSCNAKVRRIISRCRAVIVETSDHCRQVESTIKDYESQGMWSHAAELADKHSDGTKDRQMKVRALDNYKKAGYEADSLARNAGINRQDSDDG